MSKVEFEESFEEKFEKSKARARIFQRIVWSISLAIVSRVQLMISISGLTPNDVKLLDVIWNLPSIESADEFVESLVDPDERQRVLLLVELLTIGFQDTLVTSQEDCSEARDILEKIFKK